MTSILRRSIVLALTALMFANFGCNSKSSVKSTLAATVKGRDIRAVIDGPGFISPESDKATVSTPDHKIVIEQERVLLDGTELAKLPAAAAKVEVTIAGAQLTVTADGASVATKQLKK